MVYVTSYYLNTLISEEIHGTIELYRQSKNTIYFDGDCCVASQEIYDFIFSSPYFSLDLKEFLFTSNESIFIGVTKEWFCDFLNKIYLWAGSEEWLYYDVKYICDPSLNKDPARQELDFSPHSQALFYCKRF